MKSEHEHLNKPGHGGVRPSPKVAEIALRNAYDASDHACLERCLRGLTGIMDVHLDRTRVAHLSYDASRTSSQQIQSDAEKLGYSCDCWAREGSKSHAGHPQPAARTAHIRMTTPRLRLHARVCAMLYFAKTARNMPTHNGLNCRVDMEIPPHYSA